LPKKEAASIRREMEKLRKNLNGIKNMKRLPDLVVVVDQKRESTAIQECIKLRIPVISILDTNCDPDLTDIPIPANDDAIRSIKLILSKLADSIYEGNNGNFKSEELQIQGS
jgi:small subunit ribosomal protein S2